MYADEDGVVDGSEAGGGGGVSELDRARGRTED